LEGFRRGMHQMLVATDRAARGLDVERISHVVNYDVYDVPSCPERYVHRVGRTARGGEGEALTRTTPANTAWMRGIERWLGQALPYSSHQPPSSAFKHCLHRHRHRWNHRHPNQRIAL
jgi:ATP-dependent RNA helicase RhlE